MSLLHLEIESRLHGAIRAVVPDADLSVVSVRPCPDPKFGDYQTPALMTLAKQRKANPRQLAEQVKAKFELADLCEAVEIAGAGFLNFRLRPDALAAALGAAARGEHLFFQKTAKPRTVVIDFSSPNVAKPMHVGHIRSTILGDCLARTLRLLGHRVVTDNHIGDWGTQFGMLLVGWKTLLDKAALECDAIAELERIYKAVNERCKVEPATLDAARAELVKLQSGDSENLGIWQEMIRLSEVQFATVYGRLGVKFDHTYGESFYNDRLPSLVQELVAKNIARESDGAICAFSDGTLPPKEDPFLIQRDGEWQPNPQLIQKRDGAFNYATTDLATLEYRLKTWSPTEIIYVTDGRQQLHFQQVFASFRRWQPEAAAKVKFAHVWFGSILGEDGKPFKTRSGDTVKLADLLDEAEERELKLVAEKRPDLSEAERKEIARVVGIGAVKYQDLLPNRQSDYMFSWEKMLSLQGNTAPYLQYAYTRTASLQRKAAETPDVQQPTTNIQLTAAEEIALARHLLNFGITLEAVAADYKPNLLCNYLYELGGLLSRFWENCPVLKSEGPERASRLLLSNLTGRVLKQGLDVLGIETLEQM